MNCKHGIDEKSCYYCCLFNAAMDKINKEKENEREKNDKE